jgi:LmbE family N-acetylglucosaminyl deacetylase
VATLVFFHAHPDDESIQTGGTMARAAELGHRVVLVLATKGEHGEVADGFLDAGETLGERRVRETEGSASVLGVARVAYLGYVDSGMMDTPENDAPDSFWQADVEGAASRLAAILREEEADVLTTYDEEGGYGHPDHIQVHRVGVRAAELAGVPKTYMATINRDALMRVMQEARAAGVFPEGFEFPDPADFADIGVPEARITTTVDVADFTAQKRASMAAHASQISENHFFLAMPEDAFRAGMGTEWYVRVGAPEGAADEFFAGLE